MYMETCDLATTEKHWVFWEHERPFEFVSIII